VKSLAARTGASTQSAGPEACPVCRAANSTHYAAGCDRLFGSVPGTFHLFRCPSCRSIFQHPIPENSLIAGFYPEEYWQESREGRGHAFARLFGHLENAYREFVAAGHVSLLDSLSRTKASGGKLLLDIGFGSGIFLHLARRRGFEPHGMDVSARAVEIASGRYGYPVRQGAIGSKVWEGHRFDYITMFHVLEHLPDPRQGLAYAGELLKPTGTLLIQVPNVASLQARAFHSLWYGLDVPRHLINLTPEALGFLLTDMGFEYRLKPGFSLRDTPASIASSLVRWLDPIRRRVRNPESGAVARGLSDITYFGIFLLSLPAALVESALGYGGTIWAVAWQKKR
jgi:2-polyprenyl-3-methyl-5-hydroxy-6-metoxy-1,4-benzoquinol methylase